MISVGSRYKLCFQARPAIKTGVEKRHQEILVRKHDASNKETSLRDVSLLLVNPNGPGEEYDLSVVSDNRTWSVTVDHNGNIIKKERQ